MKLRVPEYHLVLREQIRRQGFRAFVGPFWDEIESIRYRPNWHADAIADHLQAVHDHEIQRLVICIPPRFGKSLYCSVLFPAYIWAVRPEEYIFNASYDLGLVVDFARRSNEVINSELFRKAFPLGATLPTHKFPIQEYSNLQGGKRFSTIVGGRSTGMGAQIQIIDDPAKASAANAEDPKILQNAIASIDGALSTRTYGDPADFRRLLVMQRLHPKDPAGHCIKDLGWEALVLPMEYSARAQWDCMSSLQFVDPRTEAGELLFPTLWGQASVDSLKKELGAANGGSVRFVAAQLNQDPQVDGGAMVERNWFGVIDEDATPWIRDRKRPFYFTTTDPSSKGEKKSHSRTAMGYWAIYHNRLYLLDVVAKHLRYPEFKDEFVRLHTTPWANARTIIVEDKANGTPLLADLGYAPEPDRRQDTRFPFTPKLVAEDPGNESKQERFRPHTDMIRHGKLTIVRAPWNTDYLNELCEFPGGDKDDLVDITAMACKFMSDSTRKGSWAQRALASG